MPTWCLCPLTTAESGARVGPVNIYFGSQWLSLPSVLGE